MAVKTGTSGIGDSLNRREDRRLVTGHGCFSDDFNSAGQVYAVIVRSPHAHAVIGSIDKSRALALSGVIAVFTGKDMLSTGVKPIPHTPFGLGKADIPMSNFDGSPIAVVQHFPLAHDKVRYIGEGVAVVIARSVDLAKDGAELVQVDYEVLASVTNTRKAAQANAPKLWSHLSSNVCLDAQLGNEEACKTVFDKAPCVVSLNTWVQRVTAMPMEPRAALAIYEPTSQVLTLHACSSGGNRLKNDLSTVLGISANRVRVLIGDVGGHFGARGMINTEDAVVAWSAMQLCQPVKWTCERHEAFLSDYQGRDLVVDCELALDEDGYFLAMRGSNISNLGAYIGNFQPLQKGVEIMSSIYRMPVVHFRARAVVSNTTPTRPYRSAGRPEVMFVMERLIDLAAAKYDFDRVEIRRKNLIAESELPYQNPFGMVYDSGAYHKVMDAALTLGDWSGFKSRQAEAKQRGKRRGIGVANYVDTATGAPRERAEITIHPNGKVEVVIGIISTGQGHETSFAQLINEWLGVNVDDVHFITGDTDIVKIGGGTHSGRGMRFASIVIWNCSQKIIEKGKKIASQMLECNAQDIDFRGGRFFVLGSDRSFGLFDVAHYANVSKDLPEELAGGLASFSEEYIDIASFPYGAHVCEVEIDPELGTVEVCRYAAVDDVGLAINPMIVHGQTHGGIVQGVGQALIEQCFYDSNSGQLLSGSFMDYAMPRADSFPMFDTQISEVPSTTHPLGIRPGGEGGTTPALGVTINAIVDALTDYGVTHIEMPATPERILRAIHGEDLIPFAESSMNL